MRLSRGSECVADEAVVVCELKQQLHEKDLRLTDIQLEALSSAHQLEQLCDTISRMKVTAASDSQQFVSDGQPSVMGSKHKLTVLIRIYVFGKTKG